MLRYAVDMNKTRTRVEEIVSHIEPWDNQESADVAAIQRWLLATDDIYRREKPAVPDRHLVSYFVLVDATRQSLLLLDHVNAGLWLPSGGHVEPDEDPYDTVQRELVEELGIRAAQVSTIARLPLFATVTQTRGAGRHTDVSLWYVVAGDQQMWIEADPREFNAYRWQTFDEVLATDINQLDPHMHRFTRKLQARMS